MPDHKIVVTKLTPHSYRLELDSYEVRVNPRDEPGQQIHIGGTGHSLPPRPGYSVIAQDRNLGQEDVYTANDESSAIGLGVLWIFNNVES